jgi:hypothetical protein
MELELQQQQEGQVLQKEMKKHIIEKIPMAKSSLVTSAEVESHRSPYVTK